MVMVMVPGKGAVGRDPRRGRGEGCRHASIFADSVVPFVEVLRRLTDVLAAAEHGGGHERQGEWSWRSWAWVEAQRELRVKCSREGGREGGRARPESTACGCAVKLQTENKLKYKNLSLLLSHLAGSSCVLNSRRLLEFQRKGRARLASQT